MVPIGSECQIRTTSADDKARGSRVAASAVKRRCQLIKRARAVHALADRPLVRLWKPLPLEMRCEKKSPATMGGALTTRVSSRGVTPTRASEVAR
jgi:hypothetical protein